MTNRATITKLLIKFNIALYNNFHYFTYHSVCHLFSSILIDNNIISIALDRFSRYNREYKYAEIVLCKTLYL